MAVLGKTNVELNKRDLVIFGTNNEAINLDSLVMYLDNYNRTEILVAEALRGLIARYAEELSKLECEDLYKRLTFFNKVAARLLAYLAEGNKEILKDYKFDSEDLVLGDPDTRYSKAGGILADFITALDVEESYKNIHGEEFLK